MNIVQNNVSTKRSINYDNWISVALYGRIGCWLSQLVNGHISWRKVIETAKAKLK
jgi:hypothetical protein